MKSEHSKHGGTRVTKLGSPVMLGLALLFGLFPFLVVSCDAPGGFGRARAGGTTSYSGVTLAVGASPEVDDAHLRPRAQRQSDDLGVQGLVLLHVLALVGALVLSIAARRRLELRLGAIAVAVVALVIGILVARAALVDKVAEQTRLPFPEGKAAGDYVKVGAGFWGALAFAAMAGVLTSVEMRCRRAPPPGQGDPG